MNFLVFQFQEILSRPAQARRSFLDHYERCFSIFCLPKHLVEEKMRNSSASHSLDTKTSGDDQSATIDIPEAPAAKQKKLDCSIVDDRGGGSIHSLDGKPDNSKYIPDSPACNQDATIVENRGDTSNESRSWVARRVDLIIAPASQYPYALMGWTGSRMFNRSVRDYANKEMNMTLTSHGLYDKINVSKFVHLISLC